MQLKTQQVKWSNKEVKRIYFEAFSNQERMPYPMMMVMSTLWNTEFLGFYDGDTACGFAYLATNRKMVFVMFLAVDKRLRSKGYGSAILQEIRSRFPNKKIIVSIEPCWDNVPDIAIRKKRKSFYMRNGYKETGYWMKLHGVVQEVLITNGNFYKKELRSFLAFYSNGTLWPRIWTQTERLSLYKG